MADIPENSRLFRKAEPPKKQLSRKFGSGKLTPDVGKRTSDFGKRQSEVVKRSSEFVKRNSEIGKKTSEFPLRESEVEERNGRVLGMSSRRTSFDQPVGAVSSAPEADAFAPLIDDTPPPVILATQRRPSSSLAAKPPRSKAAKSPAAASKPLSSQRRVATQPGKNVTVESRRASLGEGGSKPGSRRSSFTPLVEEIRSGGWPATEKDAPLEGERVADAGADGYAGSREELVSAPISQTEADTDFQPSDSRLSPTSIAPVLMALPSLKLRDGESDLEPAAASENDSMQIAEPVTSFRTSAGLEKVVVAVRVRPLTERERACQSRQAVVIQGPKITLYEEPPRAHRATDQSGASARARRPTESIPPLGAQEFTFDLVQNDSELGDGGIPRAKAELQEALFQALGHQSLNSALEGYNVTMFAYGQTGAGKSFSMMGDSTEEGAGITPRLAAALLQRLKEKRDAGTDVSVEVTYLEIYREQVRDLLARTKAPASYFQDGDSERDDSDTDRDASEPTSDSEQSGAPGSRPRAPSLRVMVQAKLAAQRFVKRARKAGAAKPPATRFGKSQGEDGDAEDDVGSDVASVAESEGSVEAPERAVRGGVSQTKAVNQGARATLKIREHPDKGPYVEGLTERHVSSWAEMAALLEEGSRNRTIAATDMNKLSSRSHTVFTLTVTQTKASPETGVPFRRVSRINLVDLAGSERQNRTNATGARLKESGFINKSLSLLNDVITELARGSDFVPYRNSSLTWLLKESLGGNSKTVMVASISPAEKDVKETLSTLRYANRAKRIKNKPVLNEDPREKLIQSLRTEIESLRAVVQSMASVPAALVVPGPQSPVAQLESATEILGGEAPIGKETLATARLDPLTENSFFKAHSVASRLLGSGLGDRNGNPDSHPDSPTSSMLTPVEGFSSRVLDDTWDTISANHSRPIERARSHTWADAARILVGGVVGSLAGRISPRGSPRASPKGLKDLLEQRNGNGKRPELRIRTRRSSEASEESFSVTSATETDPVPTMATEGTETEPVPATATESTETEPVAWPETATEGTATDGLIMATAETETDPEVRAVTVTEGTETEAPTPTVSSGTDAFLPESRSAGTETEPGVETAASSTETSPADVVTEGTETEAPKLKSAATETETPPKVVDDGTDSGVSCTDARSGTEEVVFRDSMTDPVPLELASSSTETESNGVDTVTDTEGLVAYASAASGTEILNTANAGTATDVISLLDNGTDCERAQTSDRATETEAAVSMSIDSATGPEPEPEPEVEKRIVHVAEPQWRRFEGFSSAIGAASPFLVQLLVGSDHKGSPRPEPETEADKEAGTPKDETRLLENSASNRKLVAGLRVLRRLGIAVDESVLFREASGEGLLAHALEREETSGDALKASWAVHVLAPGVNSIGSDPAVGFKLPGGLAKEHIEMVVAPPAAGKASCATVIARSLNDAPALLNGMPLPRFAELRNGDCLLLGDPSALGDGSRAAALFYFFNPLCNLPTLFQSILAPKTFSPPGSPVPLSARAVGTSGDQESGRAGFKSPLSLLLRPLDVRPPGQEAATWSLEDGPVLDVETWAFIMADELQRSGSVSNQTVGAFLEDVRTGESSFSRKLARQEPPAITPAKLPRSPRGLSFSHKGPESPPRGLSFSHRGPESPTRGLSFSHKIPESPHHRPRESPSHLQGHLSRSMFL